MEYATKNVDKLVILSLLQPVLILTPVFSIVESKHEESTTKTRSPDGTKESE